MTHVEHISAWQLSRALEGDSHICMEMQRSGKLCEEVSASVSCMQAGTDYAWLAHGTAAGIVHILHVSV